MILIDVLTDVISGKNCYIILVNYITISKGTRQKKVENSTLGGGGSKPGHFPHLKKIVFKMHFKPF